MDLGDNKVSIAIQTYETVSDNSTPCRSFSPRGNIKKDNYTGTQTETATATKIEIEIEIGSVRKWS